MCKCPSLPNEVIFLISPLVICDNQSLIRHCDSLDITPGVCHWRGQRRLKSQDLLVSAVAMVDGVFLCFYAAQVHRKGSLVATAAVFSVLTQHPLSRGDKCHLLLQLIILLCILIVRPCWSTAWKDLVSQTDTSIYFKFKAASWQNH